METSTPSSGHAAQPHVPDASLALRLAQRASAALIDAHAELPALARAQRIQALRRCLSALSADDRERCSRWLALLRNSRQGLAPELVAHATPADASPRRAARCAQAA